MTRTRWAALAAVLALAAGLFLAVGPAQADAQEAAEDAHLLKKNGSGANEAALAIRGPGSNETWAIVKFTSVPAGPATLTITPTLVRTGNFLLLSTTCGWSEATVTWANKPAAGAVLDTKPQALPTVTFNAGTLAAGDACFYIQSSNGQAQASQVSSSEHATNPGPTLNTGPAPTTTTSAPTTTTQPEPTTTTMAPTTTVAPTTTTTPPSGCVGTQVQPSDTQPTIQQALDANGPGTFCLADGRYRQGEITAGPGDILVGSRAAILDGTKVVTNWTPSGGRWVSTGQNFTPQVLTVPKTCQNSQAACHFADLFLDGQRLERVLTLTPGPGQWGWDYAADTVYLGSDPTGKTAELSQYHNGINGQGFTLRGFTIAKFARLGVTGVPAGGQGRVLDGIEARFNHDAGLHLGTDDVLSNSLVTENGKYGFVCGGAERGPTVQDSEISYNDNLYFSSIRSGGSWDEGAFKCVFTVGNAGAGSGFKFLRNWSHHNYGHGGWTDINNKHGVVQANTIEDNLLHGYFHEISCSVEISGNTLRRNGAYDTWTGPKLVGGDQLDYGWEGAGISVSSSRDASIHDNTLDANRTGITLVEDFREGGEQGCVWGLENNVVNHNSVRQPNGGIAAGYFWGNQAQQQNNPFTDNDYILPSLSTPAFNWWTCSCDNAKTFAQWQSFGQDTTGSVAVG
jgi:hypothetical protein